MDMGTNMGRDMKRDMETGISRESETERNAKAENRENRENSRVQTRVAMIGIIVEETASVERLNQLLHQYGAYIIGRMGIPYRERGINIISIAMDAPQDVISALSGKLGALKGVSSKAVYSKV